MGTLGEIVKPTFITVAPEDTLGEVAERMSAQNVGAVVVKDFGRLIGILTERDMLRAMAARVHTSDARVRQWMTENPITAPPDMTFDEASQIMLDKGFRHLPVVDGETILGIVSLRRIMGGRRPTRRPKPLARVRPRRTRSGRFAASTTLRSQAQAETTPLVSAVAAAETLIAALLELRDELRVRAHLARRLLLRRALAEQREAALAGVLRPADPAERVEVLQRGLRRTARACTPPSRRPATTFCALAALADRGDARGARREDGGDVLPVRARERHGQQR